MVGYPAVACAILNYKLAITDFMKLMIPFFTGITRVVGLCVIPLPLKVKMAAMELPCPELPREHLLARPKPSWEA